MVHNTAICDTAIDFARKSGKTEDEIRAVFEKAGHSGDEIGDALAKVADPNWIRGFRNQIDEALSSSNSGTRFEGEVGDFLENRLIEFQKKIKRADGSDLGEIDLEVAEAIIETTVGKAGKATQVRDKLFDPLVNPSQKPVIVFAPQFKKFATQAVEAEGGIVVRSYDELLKILNDLAK